MTKTASPISPDPSDAGNLDPDLNDQKGILPEGSGDGDEDDLDLEGFDLESLPEEVRTQVEEKLKEVNTYLHKSREADSLKNRSLEEKADNYDKLIADPRVHRALFANEQSQPGNAPVIKTEPAKPSYFDKDKLGAILQTEDVGQLAVYFDEMLEKAVKDGLGGFRTEVVQPLEKQAEAMTQISLMDNTYEGWRENVKQLRYAMQVYPDLDIQTAYERHVLIPNLQKNQGTVDSERRRLKDKIKGDKPGSKAEGVTKPEEFKSTKDAIIYSLEQIEKSKQKE